MIWAEVVFKCLVLVQPPPSVSHLSVGWEVPSEASQFAGLLGLVSLLHCLVSPVSPPHACSCVASPTCEESVSGSCAVLCFRDLPSAPLAAPQLTSIRPQAHARRTLSPVRSLPNLTELWAFTAPTSPPPTPTVALSAPNRVHPFWRTATGFHGPSPVLIKTSEVLSRRTEGLGW